MESLQQDVKMMMLILKQLTSSGLKAETEGFIFAVQDQSLVTKNFQANIIRNGTDPKCRFCGEKDERIDYLIAGCSVLTLGEYKRGHDRVDQYLHWRSCNHFKVSTRKNGMNIIRSQLLMVQFFGTSQSRLTEPPSQPTRHCRKEFSRQCLLSN